jgi:hypothetical protein
MDKYYIIDIEADGLIEQATTIHCLCWKDQDNREGVITDPKEMFSFLSQKAVWVAHNLIRYDCPVIEKILGIKLQGTLIDTLALSWYLFSSYDKHGLEAWGDRVNVQKPAVEDWKEADITVYVQRCRADVEINWRMFFSCRILLTELYGENYTSIIDYLSFKMKCAREQEELKWKLDVKACEKSLKFLEEEKDKRIELLKSAMPSKTVYKQISKPVKCHKIDGSLTAIGRKWKALLEELGLPLDTEDTIEIADTPEEPNPASHQQLKEWLYSLGWKPATYKMVKNKKTHEVKKVEQISNSSGDGLCPSVQLLFEKEPRLANLESLFIIGHRIGILKGFLKNRDSDDFLKAEIKGFTNTLRFQHTTIVNLPGIYKPYGREVRGCLIAPGEDMVLCGADMSALEDKTKQHYIYFHDPKYVEEMNTPGFDPHLDIAERAEMLTHEQVEDHKAKRMDYSKIRKDAKQVNFSATYGAGPPKISASSGMPLAKAEKLHKVYWERNWAIKKIARLTVMKKTSDSQMWIFNPVSRYWYSLRFEKDKFSTLNQGTGVFCFDAWVSQVRRSYLICGQFHDEVIFPVFKYDIKKTEQTLQDCIDEVNRMLKLNIKLGISVQFGNNYAEIH